MATVNFWFIMQVPFSLYTGSGPAGQFLERKISRTKQQTDPVAHTERHPMVRKIQTAPKLVPHAFPQFQVKGGILNG
jgi:hypothetical protein